MKMLGYAAAVAYVGSVILANSLATHYGMVSVGFGLTAAAGTYAAGLALGVRDVIQENIGKAAVFACIAIAGVLSYLVADAHIATASATAFTLAELFDLAVYTPMRKHGWTVAVIASNVVGAAVDTVVFLHVSRFGVTWANSEGQLVGKVLWATLLPVALIYGAKCCISRIRLAA